jgi:hypothetical protein
MSDATAGVFASPEQLLDELEALATVEHSLIIEYLLIHSLFGHDRPPSGSDPFVDAMNQAAQAAFGMAGSEMRHFHGLNQALTSAGRAAQTGRSATIDGGLLTAIAPGEPTPAIERLAARARKFADPLDDRYGRLGSVLTSPATEATAGLDLDQLAFLIDTNPDHRGAVTAFETALASVPPGDVAIWLPPGDPDAVEVSLLDLSDQWYGLLLAIIDAWFNHEIDLGGVLRGRAIDVMSALNGVNGRLVEHGRQLPRFTLPEG